MLGLVHTRPLHVPHPTDWPAWQFPDAAAVRPPRLTPYHGAEEAGMKISRHFSQDGQSPYAHIDFDLRVSEIKNPDGSTVFRQDDIAVPQAWSAVATDILAQKYFRKSGVPLIGPDGTPLLDKGGRPLVGGERDARQVFHRLAGAWTHWGGTHGYFDSPAD